MKPKTDGIIRSKEEWMQMAIAGLDESFSHLVASRNILLNSKQLTPEMDNCYKQAGQWMLDAVKEFQKPKEKPKTTEEVLKNEQKS